MTTANCSYKFMTKRDAISLAITLGFVASIPLFISLASSNGETVRTGSGIELSAHGQPLQVADTNPFQMVSINQGGW